MAYNALSNNPKLKSKVSRLFSLGTPYFIVKIRNVRFFRPLLAIVTAFYVWGLLNILEPTMGVAINQVATVLILSLIHI